MVLEAGTCGIVIADVPYAITSVETLHAALLRIVDEQIIRARETLTDPSAPADDRIHEARKRFKEIRALLRLFRKPLGAQFAHENAWFRDAGRDLSAVRDADAVLEALKKLELPSDDARGVREMLERERAAHPPLENLVANVLDQLVLAQGRTQFWAALPDSFDAIAPGLARTYRSGRRALRNHGNPDAMHAWRKRVKELWYHTQLLRELWPEMMKASASVLSTLSRALGDHHDLQVLRERIAQVEGDPPAWLDVVRTAIDERQASLQKEAEVIGARVYAEKTGAWLARMRKYWSAWERTAPSTAPPDVSSSSETSTAASKS
jgi:CHAD domain-containing protein